MIEKIDINKIRGNWRDEQFINGKLLSSGGDDTIESIRTVAEKLNEIIDLINPKE